MYKSRSSFEEFLERRQPQSEGADDMQILSRHVLANLLKNALHNQSKFTASTAAVALNLCANVHSDFKHYATKGCPGKKESAGKDGSGGGNQLLRYPAIPLKETLDRWLKTCEPVVTPAEFEETKSIAYEFLLNDGAKLQELLENVAKEEENWLADRWLRNAYLRFRAPVTIYSSPGMIFPIMDPFNKISDYTNHTGKLIYGLLRYKQLIDEGKIPVVKMGARILDNSQFSRVFGTTRVPFIIEDQMEYYPESKHIVVIYRNHFYRLNPYNEKGKPLHFEVLSAALREIMEEERGDEGIPFGILTTDTRDNWAEAYAKLICIKDNVPSVCAIQQAMFTVSLDDCVSFGCEDEKNVYSQQLIHGGGMRRNSANRWMDKTIQLIVNRNGMAGFTYEHSPAEGVPIALMCDYINDNIKKDDFYKDGDAQGSACPEKLKLRSSPCIDLYIEAAKRQIQIMSNNLDINVLHYKNYGKGFLKTQKLSPDSYIQMAIQLAFFKVHEVAGAHYESAHLRIFNGGRTETIRSCSNDSIAFACAMLNSDVTPAKKIELLRAAVKGHRDYTALALEGKGVDRHLLGLKLMAVENNLPIPAFFQSAGFVKSSHFRVATSQVASALEAFMAYGPMTDDGYACCYNPRECDIILAMSAWRDCDQTNLKSFAAAMKFALDEMWTLLTTHSGEKVLSKL